MKACVGKGKNAIAKSTVGKNALIQLIANGEYETAQKQSEHKNNIELRRWSNVPSLGGSVAKNKVLPIHQACIKPEVPLSFIQFLVEKHPNSLVEVDTKDKRTPLHLAFISHASNEVIMFLLQKCPEAVTMQDNYNRVPLHYACSNQASFTVIQKLISLCPETVGATDKNFWTPLHVASELAITVDIIEMMLNEYPQAISLCTKIGNSPSALANENKFPAREMIKERLLEEEQKVWRRVFCQNYRNVVNMPKRQRYHQSGILV